MDILISHCHVVSPDYDCADGFVLVKDGRISDFGAEPAPKATVDKVIDAKGAYVAPGFFDIHFHGRSNADFCDATLEAFDDIGRGKVSDGVTHMLGTTMTVSADCLREVARVGAEYRRRGDKNLPHMPGLHLEGPFFNPKCVGAQNPEFLKSFDIDFVDELNGICPVCKVSFSPELSGGVEFTKALVERGIMPSGGHSEADYGQFCQARDAGMKHLTHFCNVMTPVHHLRFGMVGGGLLSEGVQVEMICDGVHLMNEMIDMICRLKSSDDIMVITDSMRAAGMPDGDYSLGGQKVIVKNRRATLVDGVVAGSVGLYYEGLQRLAAATGRPLSQLIKATSWNQARSLGLDGIGRIDRGWDANLVVLDSSLKPIMTLIDGHVAWSKQ